MVPARSDPLAHSSVPRRAEKAREKVQKLHMGEHKREERHLKIKENQKARTAWNDLQEDMMENIVQS